MLKRHEMLVIFFALCWTALSFAQKPKIGLVLGGGGAKGAATIGVLEVMEEANVKVDYIAGTSIGALIGGLYASGYSTKELEDLILSQEWETILSGSKIERLIATLLEKHHKFLISDTDIPFRCVAVDYDKMTEVVLSKGPLAKAMRASMSIPGIYPPVEWGNSRLVDGGMINNLPVNVARDMGADVVIAIDLQQGEGVDFGYSTGLGGLVDWFIKRPDTKVHQRNIKDSDIYIHPDLHNFDPSSFDHNSCELMIRKGRNSAMYYWDKLINLQK